MTHMKTKKGTIAILTGGGDVPGLNPAIRGITLRALHEGYDVIGIRRGWGGLIEMERNPKVDQSEHCIKLTEEIGTWGGDIKKAELPDFCEVDYVRVYEMSK